jgi:hypothetical protein
VRLATNYDRIHGAGAEVVAVSVDDDIRQAGMARRWGLTHTRLVPDPGGEEILQPLGWFDPEERGGIALPGMLVVDPDGKEAYRYRGRDFADRTTDADIYAALGGLGLDPVEPGPWLPEAEVPHDLDRFFKPEEFSAYFRGNRFAAIAIGGRAERGSETRALAREHRLMAEASLEAWGQWRSTTQS